ncbi:hypothetical protein [Oceanimonas baumannii]|uniref:Cobalamin-independent synthase n=1 Tax=Oceanimonas baumannii TaxID=129578 RepID=A0ABY2EUK7_9GAMM|nr:hypothetical protein [Oceanimonas baumannii]TDW54386.1 cobalamin-independent synthase [Oceanimonas baumannii]
MVLSHNLGFPNIGNRQQLQLSLAPYWKGQSGSDELSTMALRTRHAAA